MPSDAELLGFLNEWTTQAKVVIKCRDILIRLGIGKPVRRAAPQAPAPLPDPVAPPIVAQPANPPVVAPPVVTSPPRRSRCDTRRRDPERRSVECA
jgi:hypothetical protein